MFGMEEQTRKAKVSGYTYEIEKELQNTKLRTAIFEKCESRLAALKNVAQGGADKEAYAQFSLLLQGYLALKKVITKVVQG